MYGLGVNLSSKKCQKKDVMPTMQVHRLNLYILGDITISYGGEDITVQLGKKLCGLVVYICMKDGAVPRSLLAELFWAKKTAKRSSANLRMALSQLRKLIPDVLEVTRQSVAIRASVDALEFQNALAKIQGSNDIASLQSALDRYTGDFLDGFFLSGMAEFETWQLQERTRFNQLYIQNMSYFIGQCLEKKYYQQGIDNALNLLKYDNLHEMAQYQLISLYVASGNRYEAIKQYEAYHAILEAELGVLPEQYITDFFHDIRQGNIEAHPLLSDDTLAMSHLPANNLTTFIGRATLIATVKKQLSQARLLTLLGTAGVGKTRLAIEIASQVRYLFADGVHFVDLTSIKHADDIPYIIWKTLEIPENSTLSLADAVLEFVKNKHMLLILDNFEHVIQDVLFIDKLLTQAFNLKLLITSREPLQLYGENIHQVVPLLGNEAHQLFVERAKALSPYLPFDQDTEEVHALCESLDYLPLAIELAALQIPNNTLHDILQGIKHRFELLVSGLRNLSPRQQSLQVAIDWSYDALSDTERFVFNRLGIFRGGWSVDAVVYLCEPLNHTVVKTTLDNLLQKSLINYSRYELDTKRYDILETLRHYALDKLTGNDEQDAIYEAHARYYQAFVEEVVKNTDETLHQIDIEYDNIRAVLKWGLQTCNPALVIEIGRYLWNFWLYQGQIQDGLYWMQLALEDEKILSAEQRITGLQTLGNLYLFSNQHRLATQCFQQTLTIAYQTENPNLVRRGLCNMALLLTEQSDYDDALELYTKALGIAESLDNMRNMAMILGDMGEVHLRLKQYDDAQDCLLKAMDYGEKTRHIPTVGKALFNLTIVSLEQGDVLQAKQYLEQCMQLAKLYGAELVFNIALVGYAYLALLDEQILLSAQLIGASQAGFERLKVPTLSLNTYRVPMSNLITQLESGLSLDTLDTALNTGRKMKVNDFNLSALVV